MTLTDVARIIPWHHHLHCVVWLVAVVAIVPGPALHADNPKTDSPPPARAPLDLGRAWQLRGRFPQALQAYDAALQADPACSEALRGRAEVLVKLQRYPEAVHSLDQYMDIGGPRNAAIYRLRGLVQAKLANYPRAIADFTAALEIWRDPTTLTRRGWAYLGNEEPRAALADFEEALRSDRLDGDAYNGRGLARVHLGQYRAAAADAEEAVRRGPAAPRLFLNAARIHAQAAGRLQAEALRDGRLLPPEYRQYRERGVQLLQKCLEAVPARERAAFWKTHLQRNVAFDPLRASAGFTRLETETLRPAAPRQPP